MLNPKKGYPEDGEIVLCTVTKIHYHSVFVSLDEYENKQGMIHISEISPGRIRNLNDYVQEGKKIICKVLKIKHDRGHIDLSLRRVSQGLRRAKAESLKQEQKAEKIIEYVAKQKDMKTEELHDMIKKRVFEKFDSLHDCFQAFVEEAYELDDLGLDKDLTKALEDVIKQRIKPAAVEIDGELSLQSFSERGVEDIRECLTKVLEDHDDIQINYLGGGKYSFKVTAKDFKKAEDTLKKVTDYLEDYMDKKDGEFSYTREEGKKAKG